MWLLHTKTLELKFYKDSKRVRYAALSHVWEADDHRQPFREIQAIYSRCLASGEDPRELVTAKVRNFLALAERDGYKWGWLDTACIDKTSSAELSEAINSMYRWYCDADVCYASLSDVADDDSPFLPESDFRSSRWHTRGWTLQELIAPHTVVFLSKSWDFIGTKASLAGVLEEITGVDLPPPCIADSSRVLDHQHCPPYVLGFETEDHSTGRPRVLVDGDFWSHHAHHLRGGW